MCGFIGVGNKDYYIKNQIKVKRAFQWLKHRGPDESRELISDNFYVGFHRLSIVGINNKKASQPIKFNRENCILMFNGEIYNYQQIAKERLSSDQINQEVLGSDTLTLKLLLEKYNLDCLRWLDGMFSIAIINNKNSSVTLIRDRYGIKPLYYMIKNNNIIFSSHIKPIIDISEHKLPNQDAIFTYLSLGLYDHSDQTFFKDIMSVPPGSVIEYNLNRTNVNKFRWYKIEEYLSSDNNMSMVDILDETENTLSEVVSNYIPKEVPFALNVSGGVDSTILVSKVKEHYENDFLLLNQDYRPPYSERPWMEEYSKLLNVSPSYHLITPDSVLKDLEETFKYQFQPFGGVTVPGFTPLYRQVNKEKNKVVLDGTGLDEAFLGYLRYGEDFFQNSSDFWDKGLIGSSGPTDKKGIRSQAISDELISNCTAISPYSSSFKDQLQCDSARMKSILDICSYKIPRTTRFTDHISSRFSIELRTPFLSHKIMHLGFKIPSKYLISEKGTKLPIRELLAKKGLSKIGFAPKRYIQSPQNEWLAKELRPIFEKYIFSNSFIDRGWLKPEFVKSEYDRYLSSSKSHSFYLWQWLSLEIWARMILD